MVRLARLDPVVATMSLLALTLALGVATPALAEVEVAHEGVGCLVAGQYPVIEARLTPPGEVARARVYFHGRGTPDWYYVDMAGEGDAAFEGVLPQPLASLDAVDYYIETLASGFGLGRTQEYSARVITEAESCSAGVRTATTLGSVPSALLVGVPEGAPAVPPGFANVGLVTSVGSAGGPAAGLVAGGAGQSGGISTGVLLGLGAAAAVGVGVALAGGGGGEGAAPSSGPPMATPEPIPTPTPTPAPDVSGRWAGTFAETPSSTQCSTTSDLVLDLQQMGGTLRGTFQLAIVSATPAPQDPCPVQAGEVFGGPLSGVVNGDAISLQLQITGGPSFFLHGTITGDQISGTSPPDSGGPGGSWEVTRQ